MSSLSSNSSHLNMATVKFHDAHKTAPILTKGTVSPAVLAQLIQYFNSYFHKCKIPNEDKVRNILMSFEDIKIDNWIKNNQDQFLAEDYTFDTFTAELRKRFLDPHWESSIVRTIVNSQMTSHESFTTFANRIMQGNNLLIGTPSRLDTAALRSKLELNMSGYLADKIARLRPTDKERISAIVIFEDWLSEISLLDEEITADLKRIADFATEHIVKKQRTENAQKPPVYNTYPQPSQRDAPAFQPPVSGANAITPGNHSYHQTSTPYPPSNAFRGGYRGSNNQRNVSGKRFRVPKLLPCEFDLLEKHSGCRKCRKFYVNHRVIDCPNDFPNPDTYVTLTEDMALQAMASAAIASTYNAHVHTPLPSSTSSPFIPQPIYQPQPTSFIEEINNETTTPPIAQNTVAAILPSSSSTPFVLGTGESDTESDPSTVSPISVPHYIWHANIHATSEFPTPIDCLLDNGAHLVLIRPETVTDLGLKIRKLKTPQCATVAINSQRHTFHLADYVVLSLSSLNNAWTSRPVRALIAADLCINILLGLPFLKHNKIVIDHELDTAIDKTTGFDLLHENNPSPLTTPSRVLTSTSPKHKRDTILHIRRQVLEELKWRCMERRQKLDENNLFESTLPLNHIASIRNTIQRLASTQDILDLETKVKNEFKQIFEPIPHINRLPPHEPARIHLKDAYKKISNRTYSCPRQYKDAFALLIQQRLESGFIRPSSSSFASPSFIIPKKDPKAIPRWVCDYRQLNANTIPDNYPLPRIDEILADCGKGKIWSTIDMTDSFFQTRIHPDDIHKTAVTTPLGAYEWCVMPMGLCNSPPIHQRRVMTVLRNHIGKICHVYMDDIVVWSQNLEEHALHVRIILQTLQDAGLYVNKKKTNLFRNEISFLGHIISQDGIQADPAKVQKIVDWPIPRSLKEVQQFLGLVKYLNAFLPHLAIQSSILSRLTHKDCVKNFPPWNNTYQSAFDKIKEIVLSRECLTVVDHNKLDSNNIYVTTDASDRCTGAVLSFGPTWETARPVAFDSSTLKEAELNYPVHEKELLAIIRAITKWKYDLVGSPFFVYTDHKTLLNFATQKDLSRRQARWMETLSAYDCKFIYVKGEDNTMADALSRYPSTLTTSHSIAHHNAQHPHIGFNKDSVVILDRSQPLPTPLTSIAALTQVNPKSTKLEFSIDDNIVSKLRDGYRTDPWCRKLISASRGMPDLTIKDGLWFLTDRLIIPADCGMREHIFRLAHDTLGHFGFHKTYESIRNSYFWPNMRKDLEEGYIPSCVDCARNKSSTSKPAGPLHPLPVPDERCQSISMDFIGPLPLDEGHDCILTITDRLASDIRIIPTSTSLTARDLAVIFFDKWYCENGLPEDIVSDRDKLFMSTFWKHLTFLTGVKCKASTSFHPQSNGASERTNKTVNQCLRFHVERNQKGWVRALPRIRFHIMSSVNKSTGYAPFQLRFGRSPRILPPLFPNPPNPSQQHISAREVIENLQTDIADARDNLFLAKISQSHFANPKRSESPTYQIGDKVMLSTLHRRKDYKNKSQNRAAKFMPRYDGPYQIVDVHHAASTITLDMPNAPNLFPTFHTSNIKPWHANDDDKYPSRSLEQPGPIEVNGSEEFLVDSILDHKKIGRGYRYLVHFTGYGSDSDRWLAGRELDNNEALDIYLKNNPDLLPISD
jgi:hypothetical protein